MPYDWPQKRHKKAKTYPKSQSVAPIPLQHRGGGGSWGGHSPFSRCIRIAKRCAVPSIRIQRPFAVVQYRVLGNGCSKLGSQKLVQGGTSRQKMHIQYWSPQFDAHSLYGHNWGLDEFIKLYCSDVFYGWHKKEGDNKSPRIGTRHMSRAKALRISLLFVNNRKDEENSVAAKTEVRNLEKYFPVVRILTAGSRSLIGVGRQNLKSEKLQENWESKHRLLLFAEVWALDKSEHEFRNIAIQATPVKLCR